MTEQLDAASQDFDGRFKAEFRARQQARGESPAELGRDIRRLFRLAYPSLLPVTRDQLASDQFPDSPAKKDLRRCVIMSHPNTLDEAIRVAIMYEIASPERSSGIAGPPRG